MNNELLKFSPVERSTQLPVVPAPRTRPRLSGSELMRSSYERTIERSNKEAETSVSVAAVLAK